MKGDTPDLDNIPPGGVTIAVGGGLLEQFLIDFKVGFYDGALQWDFYREYYADEVAETGMTVRELLNRDVEKWVEAELRSCQ